MCFDNETNTTIYSKYSQTCLSEPVVYAENFHGGVHSVAYGGHLFLVCAVRDITI